MGGIELICAGHHSIPGSMSASELDVFEALELRPICPTLASYLPEQFASYHAHNVAFDLSVHKVVRFLISPKKKRMRIEVNKIMNPAFLLGTAFNIAYWHRKYHSGTICKGVSNAQASNALSGYETH